VPFTPTSRILAALAAMYFGYRLWTGMVDGIAYGDGDLDVKADKHPVAFVLTMLTTALVAGLSALVALNGL